MGGRTIGRRTIGRGQLVAAGQSVAVQSLWTIGLQKKQKKL